MDKDTHDALLKAILAEPEADLPRLVYADFLEENERQVSCGGCGGRGRWSDRETAVSRSGKLMSEVVPRSCPRCSGDGRVSNGLSERAEFIRLMCERPGSLTVAQRTRDLHRKCGREWFPLLPESSLYRASSGNPCTVIQRGFVGEIRCPLAWWTGGPCERCERGSRTVPNWGDGDDCHLCHATGRTPAHGPEVVNAYPVTKVVATDRVAYQAMWDNVFGWHNDGWGDSGLPSGIFHHLGGHFDGSRFVKWYRTRGAAETALSDALIAWAKEQTGG